VSSNQALCVYDHEEQAEVGYLCGWHRRRMTTLTRQIADYLADLVLIAEAGTAPRDDVPKTRHLKAAEAPAPADLTVLALLDARSAPARLTAERVHRRGLLLGERWEYCDVRAADPSPPVPPVLAIVAGWLLCLAEERPLTATALPQSVLAQLALLERHHDWIAAQPWVDAYMGEMDDQAKALKAALHDRTHKRIGRCPIEREDGSGPCGGALLEENGTAVVRCGQCRAKWVTTQELARLAVILEKSA
jgi:hypothetical protein